MGSLNQVNINKYLKRYAEPEALTPTIEKHYDNVVVVPIYNEPRNCLNRTRAALSDNSCLFIAVVNCPDNAPTTVIEENLALLEHLKQQNDVLPINRVIPPIPHKQGVGLARKIGSDVALSLIQQGQIATPWIYQTDADAQLPSSLFKNSKTYPPLGALVFGHQHISCDPQLKQAANLYDLHMRYYFLGLKAAGSTYAFPTLGSTISVHATTYATVRGFPKRNAGEDFYLLNKIQKIHGVHYQPQTTVLVEARTSQRVPFGTGPALSKICQQLDSDPTGGSYLSYHPKSFELLRQGLIFLDKISIAPSPPSEMLSEIFDQLNLTKLTKHLYTKYPTQQQRATMLTEWFDGFKTLKFVHAARHFFPDQPLLESVQHCSWMQEH